MRKTKSFVITYRLVSEVLLSPRIQFFWLLSSRFSSYFFLSKIIIF